MKSLIVIDLPIDPQTRIGMSPEKCVATFYLTPPFVLVGYKGREDMSLLVDTSHNTGGWRIALPLKVLKRKIAEAIQNE